MSSNTVEDYGWENSDGPESCDYIGPEVLSILKKLNAHRIADIGSGNGTLCAELKRNGLTSVGIEYDSRGAKLARESHPDIPFYNYGVQDNPAELIESEAPFDAVVSTEVVEHLFSPHLLPAYARGILKPGGYLVVTTPYHGYLKNLALSVTNKWDHHHTALWHGGHIKFWSRDTLTNLLEENGFEVTGFSGVGRLPYLWKSMILVAKRTD